MKLKHTLEIAIGSEIRRYYEKGVRHAEFEKGYTTYYVNDKIVSEEKFRKAESRVCLSKKVTVADPREDYDAGGDPDGVTVWKEQRVIIEQILPLPIYKV